MTKVTPYKNSKSKKEQVTTMFNNIAKNYDMLNHSLSLGMDYIWRKKAVKMLCNKPKTILDIATGTADFAVCASKYTKAKITGIDISQEMLNVGLKKIVKKKLCKRITLKKADSEDLPFSDKSFDSITAGFGVRNFEDLNKGLSEMFRVLNTNGMIAILEPSTPNYFPLKQLFNLYFHHVLPTIGSWISKDKNAYKYLPESVDAFPSGIKFINKLQNAGFKECRHFPLSFGIVSLYVAIK
jgi:demethylmenaquinone methyltransferase/2-methoxy-6-polyprenyl-1,4-benzoquinol methylase